MTEIAGKRALSISGSWRLRHLTEVRNCLALVPRFDGRPVIDGSRLKEIDTSSAMLLLKAVAASGADPQLQNFSHLHLSIVRLAQQAMHESISLKPGHSFSGLADVGRHAVEITAAAAAIMAFVGSTSVEFVRAVAIPRLIRYKELAVQLELTGLNAIPIVGLVTFLIGVVTAYLGGIQTEWYGASIFIVDGVSLAMCRELSPILVAIIVAGRSGSAFTAQIGAMKLNEEIDALQTLGLSPMRVIIVPRMLALMIVMPILVFVGDIAGILGGMAIADLRFGISVPTFIERLKTVLWVKSVMVGLCKAPVFGLFIATIGCRMGLLVEGNARSLGSNTTGTVVRSIVSVILLNALFAVVLSELGI